MEGAKVRMTPKECKRLADVDFHIAVALKPVNEPSSMVVSQLEILRRIHRCGPVCRGTAGRTLTPAPLPEGEGCSPLSPFSSPSPLAGEGWGEGVLKLSHCFFNE